ncbi:protein phosphatase 2C [Bacillus cereus group sp. MYBK226-2]|uniref:protein phosphatase 2C n=1 Tax=Bacillus cereus group sp. MYBK226-2 TaxID=3450655 RepID=UPI003F791DC0
MGQMLKKLKKIIVVAATAVMLFAGFATVTPNEASAHWADGAMDWGLRNGYITADLRDSYATRQDTWLILTRIATDHSGGSNYDAARKYVMSNKISDGTNPQNYVTRFQVIQMIHRTKSPKNLYLGDADGRALDWAVKKGIYDGTRNSDPATRAEVMTMMRQAWLVGAL